MFFYIFHIAFIYCYVLDASATEIRMNNADSVSENSHPRKSNDLTSFDIITINTGSNQAGQDPTTSEALSGIFYNFQSDKSLPRLVLDPGTITINGETLGKNFPKFLNYATETNRYLAMVTNEGTFNQWGSMSESNGAPKTSLETSPIKYYSNAAERKLTAYSDLDLIPAIGGELSRVGIGIAEGTIESIEISNQLKGFPDPYYQKDLVIEIASGKFTKGIDLGNDQTPSNLLLLAPTGEGQKVHFENVIHNAKDIFVDLNNLASGSNFKITGDLNITQSYSNIGEATSNRSRLILANENNDDIMRTVQLGDSSGEEFNLRASEYARIKDPYALGQIFITKNTKLTLDNVGKLYTNISGTTGLAPPGTTDLFENNRIVNYRNIVILPGAEMEVKGGGENIAHILNYGKYTVDSSSTNTITGYYTQIKHPNDLSYTEDGAAINNLNDFLTGTLKFTNGFNTIVTLCGELDPITYDPIPTNKLNVDAYNITGGSNAINTLVLNNVDGSNLFNSTKTNYGQNLKNFDNLKLLNTSLDIDTTNKDLMKDILELKNLIIGNNSSVTIDELNIPSVRLTGTGKFNFKTPAPSQDSTINLDPISISDNSSSSTFITTIDFTDLSSELTKIFINNHELIDLSGFDEGSLKTAIDHAQPSLLISPFPSSEISLESGYFMINNVDLPGSYNITSLSDAINALEGLTSTVNGSELVIKGTDGQNFINVSLNVSGANVFNDKNIKLNDVEPPSGQAYDLTVNGVSLDATFTYDGDDKLYLRSARKPIDLAIPNDVKSSLSRLSLNAPIFDLEQNNNAGSISNNSLAIDTARTVYYSADQPYLSQSKLPPINIAHMNISSTGEPSSYNSTKPVFVSYFAKGDANSLTMEGEITLNDPIDYVVVSPLWSEGSGHDKFESQIAGLSGVSGSNLIYALADYIVRDDSTDIYGQVYSLGNARNFDNVYFYGNQGNLRVRGNYNFYGSENIRFCSKNNYGETANSTIKILDETNMINMKNVWIHPGTTLDIGDASISAELVTIMPNATMKLPEKSDIALASHINADINNQGTLKLDFARLKGKYSQSLEGRLEPSTIGKTPTLIFAEENAEISINNELLPQISLFNIRCQPGTNTLNITGNIKLESELINVTHLNASTAANSSGYTIYNTNAQQLTNVSIADGAIFKLGNDLNVQQINLDGKLEVNKKILKGDISGNGQLEFSYSPSSYNDHEIFESGGNIDNLMIASFIFPIDLQINAREQIKVFKQTHIYNNIGSLSIGGHIAYHVENTLVANSIINAGTLHIKGDHVSAPILNSSGSGSIKIYDKWTPIYDLACNDLTLIEWAELHVGTKALNLTLDNIDTKNDSKLVFYVDGFNTEPLSVNRVTSSGDISIDAKKVKLQLSNTHLITSNKSTDEITLFKGNIQLDDGDLSLANILLSAQKSGNSAIKLRRNKIEEELTVSTTQEKQLIAIGNSIDRAIDHGLANQIVPLIDQISNSTSKEDIFTTLAAINPEEGKNLFNENILHNVEHPLSDLRLSRLSMGRLFAGYNSGEAEFDSGLWFDVSYGTSRMRELFPVNSRSISFALGVDEIYAEDLVTGFSWQNTRISASDHSPGQNRSDLKANSFNIYGMNELPYLSSDQDTMFIEYNAQLAFNKIKQQKLVFTSHHIDSELTNITFSTKLAGVYLYSLNDRTSFGPYSSIKLSLSHNNSYSETGDYAIWEYRDITSLYSSLDLGLQMNFSNESIRTSFRAYVTRRNRFSEAVDYVKVIGDDSYNKLLPAKQNSDILLRTSVLSATIIWNWFTDSSIELNANMEQGSNYTSRVIGGKIKLFW